MTTGWSPSLPALSATPRNSSYLHTVKQSLKACTNLFHLSPSAKTCSNLSCARHNPCKKPVNPLSPITLSKQATSTWHSSYLHFAKIEIEGKSGTTHTLPPLAPANSFVWTNLAVSPFAGRICRCIDIPSPYLRRIYKIRGEGVLPLFGRPLSNHRPFHHL